MSDGNAKTVETERNREVSTEYVRLLSKAEELHNRAGLLLDRLAPLMRDNEPKQQEGAVPQKGYGCQFARDLEVVTDKLSDDVAKVNQTIDRLEL